MRRWVLVATGVIVATLGAQPSRAADSAQLTIVAVGADMEFRTLNLSPAAFTVRAGEARIFQNLKPDRYVVVQAPPLGVGMWIQCSDGASSNQYDLQVGDDLTCTFTAP